MQSDTGHTALDANARSADPEACQGERGPAQLDYPDVFTHGGPGARELLAMDQHCGSGQQELPGPGTGERMQKL